MLAFLAAAYAAEIPVVTFDGAKSTTYKFVELNDPVMGGKSTGTWHLEKGYGVFDGEVVDVPSLKAPGFIKASADGKFSSLSSAVDGKLLLKVRSSTPSYQGFRVSFATGTLAPSYACSGGGTIPFSRGCFKAHFTVPAGKDFTTIAIPFRDFSDMWSPATGKHTKECASDKDVCPTAKSLAGIKRFEVWAEGALGKVHLEIASISAQSSAVFALGEAEATVLQSLSPPAKYDTCSSSVQSDLQYGISAFNESQYFPDETLAAAVCCDSRMASAAEPRFLFEGVQLFKKLEVESGVTTFYDSVCGLPVFRAPVGRSIKEFEADTKEHGWPSFRTAEIVKENIMTNHTSGYVTSKCGTHLGSYLPDKQGPRWCIDLSCIAGKKPASMTMAAGSDTTLYKISGNECGQATLDSKYATYAEKFANLKEGTCASQGYTVADGSQTMNVPVLGKISISKFKKA